ncbi:MAG: AmpG family muropeptide MFS transporter [Gammaproteobacteria bacterium]
MSGASARDWLQLFSNRRIAATLLLGFSSGLPLALVGGTLQAWFTVSGVDIVTIGFLGLVGQPYVYKFLWAPFMDRFVPPLLGRRRGWLLLTQIAVSVAIAAMALFNPAITPGALSALALVVAFLSASQDIAVDAYRTDVLQPRERGLGAAVSVGGYRMAMIVSGGLALILADHIGWSAMYLLMAASMAIGVLGTLLGPEPEIAPSVPSSLAQAVLKPWQEFMARRAALALLLLIVLYKLGDAFAGSLTLAFLLRGAGFTLTEIGAVYKTVSLVATLVGAVFGGSLLASLGLYRALLLFGVLQALSNLGFMWLALSGKSMVLMVSAVAFENFAGGMGTAAFVALLMALCDHRYTATQYALLSALSAIGRVFVGPAAGYLVTWLGWPDFFAATFATALPGLGLLWLLRVNIRGLENKR